MFVLRHRTFLLHKLNLVLLMKDRSVRSLPLKLLLLFMLLQFLLLMLRVTVAVSVE